MKLRVDKQRLSSYWFVWKRLTLLQFQVQIANARLGAILLILGKLFRLATAFLLVYIILSRAKALMGYNLKQAMLILALFNFFSTLTQLFFRGVYVFRQKIKDGSFDFYLLNPLNELFYALFSYTDPLDLLLVIPYFGLVVWAWFNAGANINLVSLLLFLAMLFTTMLFSFAFHVFVVAIGVKYLEVDNTVMLYRDLEKMASLPIEIYGKHLSLFLTYFIPLGFIATIPVRIIFGLTSPLVLVYFFLLAILFVFLSLRFWQRSLKSYTSASS